MNELRQGTQIDNRYLVQRILGQGGLGRTYLAFDTHRFNEPCVLKEFTPLNTGDIEFRKARDLFKREAKILHKIHHPQIPEFLACFEDRGRLFLVQEFVNGKTYAQLLQERQKQGKVFEESEVIQWSLDLLPVLDYIHSCGIIHRDISPDNVMQPQQDRLPVLIDFGIGKLALSALENESEENIDSEIRRASFVGKISFVGKMGYAPREQISMGICSPSSDLYALGVTAIVLLTGREPMQLMSRDSLEWEWRKYAKVSNAFAEILSKLIADLPRHRYQSAQEVLSHLKRLTRGDRLSLDSAPSSFDRERKSPHQNSIPQSHQTRSLEETYLAIPNSNPEEKNKPAPTSRERELDETVLISPQPSPQPHRALDPNFIDLCQKELAQAIGPIAHLIISEVLQQNSQISATQLADRLESYIRDPQLAKKFKQRLNFGKFPS